MRNFFYFRLALTNIKKHARSYVPYIITCVITIAMFYIIKSLAFNLDKNLSSIAAATSMSLGCIVVAIFAIIFLFYTNSFLLKKRKKEFGLYNILGMEKKHMSALIATESLIISVISLVLGLIIGIALDKLIFMIVIKLLDGQSPLGFTIIPEAILHTVVLFCIIFAAILLNSVRIVYTTKTIDLLQGSNTGEKEPKTKWLLAILGVLCLGGGYTISIISKNPVTTIGLLFIAIVLVVIGTYFIFVAGITVLLKLLRKNKGFYYKTSHFISISGMIYRMKQNAVGLANICVLSTMVLVMISTTSSLFIGMQDAIDAVLPYDYKITVANDETTNQQVKEDLKKTAADNNIKITKFVDYEYLEFNADLKYNCITASDYSVESKNLVGLIIVTQQDYNMLKNSNVRLSDGQVMMFYPNSFPYSDLTIFDQRYKVKESRKISDFIPGKSRMGYSIYDSYGIVVKDNSQLEQISKYFKSYYSNTEFSRFNCSFYDCGFNVDADQKKQLEFNQVLENSDIFDNLRYKNFVSYFFKSTMYQDFRDTYSSMFFLGIFLSILFIMATILIIYYKQISESYDDKERYEIMQNVGMSHTEVKRTIRSQVLTVFFLPLIVAGIHVAFAFPIMSRVLSLLGLINVTLYIICTVICFLVFALMYGIIFAITSRLYYKTVNKKQA
ncbi:MAG: ABC transporter permease [Oscillospiraceae bacterium]|nr:ABC transporter permease [Oscillospiraceae bacterium]